MNDKVSIPKVILVGLLTGFTITGIGRFFIYINGPMCSIDISAFIGMFTLALGEFPIVLIFGDLEYTFTICIVLLIIQGLICSIIALLVMLVRRKITKPTKEITIKGLVLRIFIIYVIMAIALFIILANIRL